MVARRAGWILALLLFSGPKLACQPVGVLDADPIVWPDRAYLGETIAIPVDTNNLAGFPLFEDSEEHDATIDTVSLQLPDANGDVVTFTPRSVITVGPSGAAKSGETLPGITVTIALLDLPTVALYPTFDYAPNYPVMTHVTIVHNGVPTSSSGKLTILGPETDPAAKGAKDFVEIWGATPLEEGLAPRPSLRLRAHGPTDCTPPSLSFPNGKISGMEFEIEYDTTRVSEPDPIPTAEAGRATATASVISTAGTLERARVLILDPDGFRLTGDAGNCRRGTGPFLDIAFTKHMDFDTSHFTIDELYVTRFNGQPLIDERGTGVDSADYFEIILRDNL